MTSVSLLGQYLTVVNVGPEDRLCLLERIIGFLDSTRRPSRDVIGHYRWPSSRIDPIKTRGKGKFKSDKSDERVDDPIVKPLHPPVQSVKVRSGCSPHRR